MKNLSFATLALLSLTLSGCLTAAGFGGTDVGNPDVKKSDTISGDLSVTSCETLNFCYAGFNRAECQRASLEVEGIAATLGDSNGASTLVQADAAIAAGTVAIVPIQRSECLGYIRRLRCNDLPLNRIWQTQQPGNYRGLLVFWGAMRGVCGNVLRATGKIGTPEI